MVATRNITLLFTWASTRKDDDGYAKPNAAETLALEGRLDRAAPSLAVGGAGGDRVKVEYKFFTDCFTDTLPEGARVTVNGKQLRVVFVQQYQMNAEVWLA